MILFQEADVNGRSVEWPCWQFANWIPGAHEFSSFFEALQAVLRDGLDQQFELVS